MSVSAAAIVDAATVSALGSSLAGRQRRDGRSRNGCGCRHSRLRAGEPLEQRRRDGRARGCKRGREQRNRRIHRLDGVLEIVDRFDVCGGDARLGRGQAGLCDCSLERGGIVDRWSTIRSEIVRGCESTTMPSDPYEPRVSPSRSSGGSIRGKTDGPPRRTAGLEQDCCRSGRPSADRSAPASRQQVRQLRPVTCASATQDLLQTNSRSETMSVAMRCPSRDERVRLRRTECVRAL